MWERRDLTDGPLDPDALLWDIRRRLRLGALPARRTVVGFVFTDLPADDSEGFDTDLEIHGNTRTRWWLGELRWARLLATGAVKVTGPRDLQREFSPLGLRLRLPGARAQRRHLDR